MKSCTWEIEAAVYVTSASKIWFLRYRSPHAMAFRKNYHASWLWQMVRRALERVSFIFLASSELAFFRKVYICICCQLVGIAWRFVLRAISLRIKTSRGQGDKYIM